jgi:hypothetical protein
MASHNGTLNPSFVSAFAMSRVHNALRRIEHMGALSLSSAGVEPEHWLLAFMEDLLAQFRASDDISFEATQRLLQRHEQAFLKDLDTARRMYRTYPHLFPEEGSQQMAWSKAAQA